MVWRSISLSVVQKILLIDRRATWNIRYRVRIKSVALLQNCKLKLKKNSVVFKRKKCLFLRKLTEMSNLILFFSEISKIFICIRVRQGAFLSEDWKYYPSVAVSSFFSFRNAWKESISLPRPTSFHTISWSKNFFST